MTLLFANAASTAQVASGWSLGAPEFLFIVILIFAVIGFQRGWRRELVTLGFYLGVILLLTLGGGTGIASFFMNTLPQALQVIAGNAKAKPPNVVPTADNVRFVELITLAVVIGAGYLISQRAFNKPSSPPERLLGILPAIVSGYALVFFLTNHLLSSGSSGQIQLLSISAPGQDAAGSALVIIFVIAVVVVVAALIAANAKKPSSGKK
jgi:uncharacterized membrane protein YoaK (UPF0700 family)